MTSSESLKVRAARPRGDGVLAAETMVDLEKQIDTSGVLYMQDDGTVPRKRSSKFIPSASYSGTVPLEEYEALEVADTEARLAIRKNLETRPLGLMGLLDKRGQIDLRSILPVMHSEEDKKHFEEEGLEATARAYLSRHQTPTYEELAYSTPGLRETGYVAKGIPQGRVWGSQKPVVLMPGHIPRTGVDIENPELTGHDPKWNVDYGEEDEEASDFVDFYRSSVNTPAHEGFHRLLRNREGLLDVGTQRAITSQIPFMDKYRNTTTEHMFLAGLEYVLAPESMKKDPKFKRLVDTKVAGFYNNNVNVAKRASKDDPDSKFTTDSSLRPYFVKSSLNKDYAEKPTDEYYQLVEDRYKIILDRVGASDVITPQTEGKNKGGYVITGAETMMGLD